MRISKDLLISESQPLKWLQYAVYGSVILYFGRNIFIPINFALLISFILYPICAWFQRKGMGRLMAVILSISLLMIFGLLVLALLIYQFFGFLDEWPVIQVKLSQAVTDLSQ
ncbi:MAG: hypothetical protein C0490_10895, partial [Marivirga sp.]|nr:hypothetical protein [Marivirga sp.]